MKHLAAVLFFGVIAAAPSHATGGMVCSTAGARPIEVALGFGHVPGSPLIAARLIDAGREVPASPAQWWLDNDELRLILVGANAMEQALLVKAKRNGAFYDGSLWRGGKRRWVRCREG